MSRESQMSNEALQDCISETVFLMGAEERLFKHLSNLLAEQLKRATGSSSHADPNVPEFNQDEIRYMADRFLNWKLPEDFSPGCGITFDAGNCIKHRDAFGNGEDWMENQPYGMNLLTPEQAEEMIKYILEV